MEIVGFFFVLTAQIDDLLEQDLLFMRLAIDNARVAEALDEVPIGAVVVFEGQVIATGYNRTRLDGLGACNATGLWGSGRAGRSCRFCLAGLRQSFTESSYGGEGWSDGRRV